MTLQEKEKKIIRLYSRMIKFQSLCLYAQKYDNNVTHNRNRFDNIIESILPSLNQAVHLKSLAFKLVKLKATKTIC